VINQLEACTSCEFSILGFNQTATNSTINSVFNLIPYITYQFAQIPKQVAIQLGRRMAAYGSPLGVGMLGPLLVGIALSVVL
jgi:hypothetical protein